MNAEDILKECHTGRIQIDLLITVHIFVDKLLEN